MLTSNLAAGRDSSGRGSVYWLLSAQGISLIGTRLSFLALPWFVLTTTGSVARTGLVGLVGMLPYVTAKALSGPVIDRFGGRPVSVVVDVASVCVVGIIPLLYAVSALSFPILLGLIALAGAARGPGDAAKHALVPAAAGNSSLPLEKAVGISGTIDQLATVVGPAVAGVVITVLGPFHAVVIDAVTFAAAVLAVVKVHSLSAPEPSGSSARSFLRDLVEAWAFIRRQRFLRSVIVLVAVTNLLDAGLSGVLLLVWSQQADSGAAAVGVTTSALGCGALLGSVAATALAGRLPRRLTYVIAYIIAGAPRFIVVMLPVPLAVVVAVWAASGLAAGVLNPIMGTIVYELIPPHLLGRVGSLGDALAWAGIPFGGPLASGMVLLAGLPAALAASAAAYLAVTMWPAFSGEWRTVERGRPKPASAPPPD